MRFLIPKDKIFPDPADFLAGFFVLSPLILSRILSIIVLANPLRPTGFKDGHLIPSRCADRSCGC